MAVVYHSFLIIFVVSGDYSLFCNTWNGLQIIQISIMFNRIKNGDLIMLEIALFVIFVYWLFMSGLQKTFTTNPIRWGCGFLMMVFAIILVLLILL